MSLKDVEAFTVEANIGSDKARKSSDGRYISCPLPDEVRELGFEVGDKLSLALESDVVDGEEVYFVRYSREDIGRHSLQIRINEENNPELYIRIPIEYTFYREGQPFHGLDKDDQITVEANYRDSEIRIYPQEDYTTRLKQLADDGVFPEFKKPIFAPLIGVSRQGFTDLTRGIGLGEQNFKLVAVDGRDEKLFKTIFDRAFQPLGQATFDRIVRKGSDNLIQEFRKDNELPAVVADRVTVFWDPGYVDRPDAEDMTWGSGTSSEWPDQFKGEKIYEDWNTSSVKLILPNEGAFEVEVEVDGETGRIPIYSDTGEMMLSDSIDDEWDALLSYVEEDSDVYNLLVPVPDDLWPDYW
jgi:hypothetical protein